MSKASTSSVALAASERSGEAANATGAPAPDPEVTARSIRRRFTAEYKCSVLDQAEAAQQVGAVGALLRREGLYSSLLSTWRRQRPSRPRNAVPRWWSARCFWKTASWSPAMPA